MPRSTCCIYKSPSFGFPLQPGSNLKISRLGITTSIRAELYLLSPCIISTSTIEKQSIAWKIQCLQNTKRAVNYTNLYTEISALNLPGARHLPPLVQYKGSTPIRTPRQLIRFLDSFSKRMPHCQACPRVPSSVTMLKYLGYCAAVSGCVLHIFHKNNDTLTTSSILTLVTQPLVLMVLMHGNNDYHESILLEALRKARRGSEIVL